MIIEPIEDKILILHLLQNVVNFGNNNNILSESFNSVYVSTNATGYDLQNFILGGFYTEYSNRDREGSENGQYIHLVGLE